MSCHSIELVLKLYALVLLVSFQTILAEQEAFEDNFLVNLLSGGSSSSNEIADPGEPFVKIDQRYFIIHQGRKVTWYEALYLCTTYGAQLSDIRNDEEMQALTHHLLSLQITDYDFFWISGNNLMNPNGTFNSANTQQRMSYTNWRPGQPDKAGNVEFCAHLWPETTSYTVRMNDLGCDNDAHFICVHPTAIIQHTPNSVVTIQPAPPQQRHDQIGSKYYLVMDLISVNWATAKGICNSHSAMLAQIQNDFEMNAISNYIIMRGYNNNEFWIAGNDRHREGAFMWTEEDFNIEVTYTKWSQTNPNNYMNSQHCMVLWKVTHEWTMDDDDCQKTYNFICQYPTQYPRYKIQ